MPESDVSSNFVTRYECQTNIKNLEKTVEQNHETNMKILKILQGNGDGGLIWKVNTILIRNQLIDKGFSMIIAIISSLITLYLTGALHL